MFVPQSIRAKVHYLLFYLVEYYLSKYFSPFLDSFELLASLVFGFVFQHFADFCNCIVNIIREESENMQPGPSRLEDIQPLPSDDRAGSPSDLPLSPDVSEKVESWILRNEIKNLSVKPEDGWMFVDPGSDSESVMSEGSSDSIIILDGDDRQHPPLVLGSGQPYVESLADGAESVLTPDGGKSDMELVLRPVNRVAKIKPEPVRSYVHKRNQTVNQTLNLLLALTFSLGVGLGIGHFLGLTDDFPHRDVVCSIPSSPLENGKHFQHPESHAYRLTESEEDFFSSPHEGGKSLLPLRDKEAIAAQIPEVDSIFGALSKKAFNEKDCAKVDLQGHGPEALDIRSTGIEAIATPVDTKLVSDEKPWKALEKELGTLELRNNIVKQLRSQDASMPSFNPASGLEPVEKERVFSPEQVRNFERIRKLDQIQKSDKVRKQEIHRTIFQDDGTTMDVDVKTPLGSVRQIHLAPETSTVDSQVSSRSAEVHLPSGSADLAEEVTLSAAEFYGAKILTNDDEGLESSAPSDDNEFPLAEELPEELAFGKAEFYGAKPVEAAEIMESELTKSAFYGKPGDRAAEIDKHLLKAQFYGAPIENRDEVAYGNLVKAASGVGKVLEIAPESESYSPDIYEQNTALDSSSPSKGLEQLGGGEGHEGDVIDDGDATVEVEESEIDIWNGTRKTKAERNRDNSREKKKYDENNKKYEKKRKDRSNDERKSKKRVGALEAESRDVEIPGEKEKLEDEKYENSYKERKDKMNDRKYENKDGAKKKENKRGQDESREKDREVRKRDESREDKHQGKQYRKNDGRREERKESHEVGENRRESPKKKRGEKRDDTSEKRKDSKKNYKESNKVGENRQESKENRKPGKREEKRDDSEKQRGQSYEREMKNKPKGNRNWSHEKDNRHEKPQGERYNSRESGKSERKKKERYDSRESKRWENKRERYDSRERYYKKQKAQVYE